MFNRIKKDFLRCFVTVNETWTNHSTPETKEQLSQWIDPDESKANVGLSANKVMITVFWDAYGIIHISFTGIYYAELLERFNANLKQKRPHLQKKVLFHQDNAPARKSSVAMQKLHELPYELVPHSPLSPDLGPSDYYLFQNLKK